MTSSTCAAGKTLQLIKDVSPEHAKKIRSIWCALTRQQLIEQFTCVADHVGRCLHPPSTRTLRRIAIDNVIGTFGVVHLGSSRRTGKHVYYCNAGDTYATTVIFSGPHLRVGCWGDLIERHSVRALRSA